MRLNDLVGSESGWYRTANFCGLTSVSAVVVSVRDLPVYQAEHWKSKIIDMQTLTRL